MVWLDHAGMFKIGKPKTDLRKANKKLIDNPTISRYFYNNCLLGGFAHGSHYS